MVERENPFCVIRKEPWGEHGVHDIQTSGAWESNPYGEEYAVVPDSMVQDIITTSGFVEIMLNEDETEVVSFTPLEIPEITAQETEPTQLDMLEAQVTYTALMTDTLL